MMLIFDPFACCVFFLFASLLFVCFRCFWVSINTVTSLHGTQSVHLDFQFGGSGTDESSTSCSETICRLFRNQLGYKGENEVCVSDFARRNCPFLLAAPSQQQPECLVPSVRLHYIYIHNSIFPLSRCWLYISVFPPGGRPPIQTFCEGSMALSFAMSSW